MKQSFTPTLRFRDLRMKLNASLCCGSLLHSLNLTAQCTLPGFISDTLMTYPEFTAGFSFHHQVPAWVSYEFEQNELRVECETEFGYRPVITGVKARDAHYTHSGYERGHLAPAADFRFSCDALQSTYSLANTVPINGLLNKSAWRSVENAVRDSLMNHHVESLCVHTGVFCGDKKIADTITLPTHLYKLVWEPSGNVGQLFYSVNDSSNSVSTKSLDNIRYVDEEVVWRLIRER